MGRESAASAPESVLSTSRNATSFCSDFAVQPVRSNTRISCAARSRTGLFCLSSATRSTTTSRVRERKVAAAWPGAAESLTSAAERDGAGDPGGVCDVTRSTEIATHSGRAKCRNRLAFLLRVRDRSSTALRWRHPCYSNPRSWR